MFSTKVDFNVDCTRSIDLFAFGEMDMVDCVARAIIDQDCMNALFDPFDVCFVIRRYFRVKHGPLVM